MRERLESVGVKPGMAALIDAMITINCGGPVHNLTKELNLCAGYFMSVATKLEIPKFPSSAWVWQFKERQKNIRIAEQNTQLHEMESEGLNPAQEESLDDLTKIPPIFDRRATQEDESMPEGAVSHELVSDNEVFYRAWDDVEIDARIEELQERNDLSGAQWSELSNLEQEQDRRREDADPNDEPHSDESGWDTDSQDTSSNNEPGCGPTKG